MRALVILFFPLLIGLPASGSAATDSSIDPFLLAQSTTLNTSANVSSSAPETIYGPVRSSENLWKIAKRYQVENITMSQLVMSIYGYNRSAFYGNNINRLRTGVRLKIPSIQTISDTQHRQAYSTVVEHIAAYEAYINNKKQKTIETGSTVDSTVTSESLVSTAKQNKLPVDIELTDIAVIKQELVLEHALVQAKTEEPAPVEVPAKPQQRKPKPQSKPLFRYSYDVSVAHDDNIRKAQNEVDIRADNILSLTLNAKAGKSISRFSLLTYGGSFTLEKFQTFKELDNISVDANVRYRFAFSSGFTAPIYSIGLKVGGLQSDKVARDSTMYTVNLGLNKWITNTINMSLGLNHKQRESRSRVFDTSENSLFANLDINLSKKSLLYTTYTYIAGDIVSSATPTLAIINAADEIEPDDAFGGITTNQFAYRLDADTQVITLGYNHILSAKMSLDFSYRRIKTESSWNVEYDRSIFRASLLGRF